MCIAPITSVRVVQLISLLLVIAGGLFLSSPRSVAQASIMGGSFLLTHGPADAREQPAEISAPSNPEPGEHETCTDRLSVDDEPDDDDSGPAQRVEPRAVAWGSFPSKAALFKLYRESRAHVSGPERPPRS